MVENRHDADAATARRRGPGGTLAVGAQRRPAAGRSLPRCGSRWLTRCSAPRRSGPASAPGAARRPPAPRCWARALGVARARCGAPPPIQIGPDPPPQHAHCLQRIQPPADRPSGSNGTGTYAKGLALRRDALWASCETSSTLRFACFGHATGVSGGRTGARKSGGARMSEWPFAVAPPRTLEVARRVAGGNLTRRPPQIRT